MAELEQLLKGKTPVSFLQEICSKRKLTPSYSVLANEGPVHEPVFVMKAQAGEFQGTGKGSSKKKAKHNAAAQLLCAMHNIKGDVEDGGVVEVTSAVDQTTTPINGLTQDQQMSSGMFDSDSQGNPIGELQEYTQKSLLRPPQYQYIGEQGPPHAREFVCTVKLAKLQETAVGKSKKIAKRAAASKLLQSVRQLQNDTSNTTMLDEEEEELSLPMGSQQTALKSKDIPQLSAEAARKANDFFGGLRRKAGESNNQTLQRLLMTHPSPPTTNHIKVLADFAKQKKFDIRYLDINEKSHSGQYQCLVQICTAPIAVCYGMGSSLQEARSCAAYNALQYLKLMTTES